MGVIRALRKGHVALDCVPHICSSKVAPGDLGGLGGYLLHKYSTKITASFPGGLPRPAFPHSSSLTRGEEGWQPP